ncbi:MAG: NAD(P)-dependent glycerol-3-phosphate dehydrogenase [Candidatus Omnitrophica bacterium]|nr:NAD(P)-dependent glycerol-3-phosphate dehydrogenase [Candidatus Omnitrophota bacterium]
MDSIRIAILGDGGWGTALALVLARKGLSPTLWGVFPHYIEEIKITRENKKYLPRIKIPQTINFSSNLQQVVEQNDVLVVAIPTIYLRGILEKISTCNVSRKIVVSCVKGIENETLLTPSRIIHECLRDIKLAVLSGPSHAEEVARNIPTCVVATSENHAVAKKVQEIFMETRFRVYTSNDLIGVELGGALKNVIAIAAGLCDGLDFGANTKAALLSRGLQEIIRLGIVLGAKAETFFGLSGMGDLVTTCISSYGRNRSVGERIARGEKIKDIVGSMEMIAEGVKTTRSAFNLAEKHSIDMPITSEVYQVLYKNKSPLQSISDLMLRDSKDEIDKQTI